MPLVFNLKNVLLLFFKYIYLFIKFIINYLVVFIFFLFGGGGGGGGVGYIFFI